LKLVLIAAAGAAGTLARFAIAEVVPRGGVGSFPWAVFLINMLGCLLFGAVVSLAEGRWGLSETTRLVALTGFMGAFTTFSTFAYDTAAFLRAGEYLLAFGNVMLQNSVGVLCLFAGLRLGQAL